MGYNFEGKFNVATGAIIEADGKILLIKRSPHVTFTPDIWEVVSGRMKQGEELDQALKREIQEETGITEVKIIKPINIHHFYRGEKTMDNETILIIYWVKTTELTVTLSPEHTHYQWINPKDISNFTIHPEITRDIEIFIKEVQEN